MVLYGIMIAILIVASAIAGITFALKDLKHNKKNKSKLSGLDNKDIPCGSAFTSLEICNSWEE